MCTDNDRVLIFFLPWNLKLWGMRTNAEARDREGTVCVVCSETLDTMNTQISQWASKVSRKFNSYPSSLVYYTVVKSVLKT